MLIRSSFFLWTTCLLIISTLVLIFIFPVNGNIDLYLIRPWVNTSGHFPLRDSWYLAQLNHRYVKHLITAVYVAFFILWCASFKVEGLKAQRWSYGYMFWVSMLCTCLIGFIKAHSSYACPWDMTHESATGFLWDFSANAGHCFPGGHASTGFAVMTGYFVYRLSQPKRAWFYLGAGLILGFMMGWAQMMRGAHFLSHNLWTAWIILAINFSCYLLTFAVSYGYKSQHAMPSPP